MIDEHSLFTSIIRPNPVRGITKPTKMASLFNLIWRR